MNDVSLRLTLSLNTGPGLSSVTALSTTSGDVRMPSYVHCQHTFTLADIWADQSTAEDSGKTRGFPFAWGRILDIPVGGYCLCLVTDTAD